MGIESPRQFLWYGEKKEISIYIYIYIWKPRYLLYLGTAGSCCLGEPELVSCRAETGLCSQPVQREVSVVSTAQQPLNHTVVGVRVQ